MTNQARKIYWEEFYAVTGELSMMLLIPLALWTVFKENELKYEWIGPMTIMAAVALFIENV